MAHATSQRAELARLCSSKDWSKAIQILDSLVSHSCSIQDICNRAFCYSQLELHKHVIKDSDRPLQLDPARLQPYILKGHALSALGRKTDALLVWEQGYEHAQNQSSDLKLLLELEELLTMTKEGNDALCEANGLPMPQSEWDSPNNGDLTEICKNLDGLGAEVELCDDTSNQPVVLLKSSDKFDSRNELSSEERESNKPDGLVNGSPNSLVNGSPDFIDKLSYNSESCNDSSNNSE